MKTSKQNNNMKKNLWNKLFHSKKLKEQDARINECKKLIGFGPETIQFIQGSQTLDDLLRAHKIAWERGYRNENLGPCSYGMFRTDNISKMTSDEVYLGDIYGLWTFNIPHWNQHKEALMQSNGWGIDPSKKVYDIIMGQYRRLLLSNINSIINGAKDELSSLS